MSPMSVALPRPILKHSSQSHPNLSNDSPLSLHLTRQCRNTVHFPPSPTLTRTFSAHSPSAYDRTPIVVAPNICALPARGCPGRTYIPGCSPLSPSGSPSRKAAINSGGRHMHPRCALGFGLVQEVTPDDLTEIPPPLIPDISSESDESDGFTGPPSGSDANATATVTNPLTFLPFASLSNLNTGESAFQSPESPKVEEDYQYHRYEEGKRRRRRRDRGKGGREQSSRQRALGLNMGIRDLEANPTNGISGEELEEDDEAEDDDIAECRYKSFCSGTSFGGYGLGADDETCLGGF